MGTHQIRWDEKGRMVSQGGTRVLFLLTMGMMGCAPASGPTRITARPGAESLVRDLRAVCDRVLAEHDRVTPEGMPGIRREIMRAMWEKRLNGLDIGTKDDASMLANALRLSVVRSEVYAEIARALVGKGLKTERASNPNMQLMWPSLLDAVQITRNRRVAVGLITALWNLKPQGWQCSLAYWLDTQVVDPGWWAALILQGEAGEDWGLDSSRAAEQDVDRGRDRARAYLEKLRGRQRQGPSSQPVQTE